MDKVVPITQIIENNVKKENELKKNKEEQKRKILEQEKELLITKQINFENKILNIKNMLINELETNEKLQTTLNEIIKKTSCNYKNNILNVNITSVLFNFKDFNNKELTKQLLIELLNNDKFNYTIENENSILHNITIHIYVDLFAMGYKYNDLGLSTKNCKKYLNETYTPDDGIFQIGSFSYNIDYSNYISTIDMYKFCISTISKKDIKYKSKNYTTINYYSDNQCTCFPSFKKKSELLYKNNN